MATWDEMTEAERAHINAEEDARESRKDAFAGADEYFSGFEDAPVQDDPSEDELVAMAEYMEERAQGHKDHHYW